MQNQKHKNEGLVDYKILPRLSKLASYTYMSEDKHAAKAYPEYLIEMKYIGESRYEYIISIGGVEVDKGIYKRGTIPTGTITKLEDPYGEIARDNSLAVRVI